MRILNRGRRTGKTTQMINYCYLTNTPLIVFCHKEKMRIKKEYPLGEKIEVYTIQEVLSGRADTKDRVVNVDELDLVLNEIMSFHKIHIDTATITFKEDSR